MAIRDAYAPPVPRQPRLFVPDGIYHAASHGSDDRALFLTDRDRERFLERLALIVERYELSLIAYCLMGNHYHLIVQTPDARLSRGLKDLNGGYAQQFNRLHARSAHLIRAHPIAQPIEGDSYLLSACRYLAWNPVRAKLCGQPAEWAWSSYRASVGLEIGPCSLSETLLRGACGGGVRWRERYRDFVEAPWARDMAETVERPSRFRHIQRRETS